MTDKLIYRYSIKAKARNKICAQFGWITVGRCMTLNQAEMLISYFKKKHGKNYKVKIFPTR